jgi:hypothetical protein
MQGLKVVPCGQSRTMMEVIRTGMKHRCVFTAWPLRLGDHAKGQRHIAGQSQPKAMSQARLAGLELQPIFAPPPNPFKPPAVPRQARGCPPAQHGVQPQPLHNDGLLRRNTNWWGALLPPFSICVEGA